MKFVTKIFTPLLLLLAASCSRSCDNLQPQICYTVQDRYLKQLPSPFLPLSEEEKSSDWGREMLIGQSFARELDLYRAITAFKRALFLLPKSLDKRHLEMEYEILLAYYLGRRYEEAEAAFRESSLPQVSAHFPAYRDLLTILYDIYQKLGLEEKASQVLQLQQQHDPTIHEGLLLSSALEKADFPALRCLDVDSPYRSAIEEVLSCYDQSKKSPVTAQWLNGLIPGSGYLYLGQRQTAITAFLVNGLFITAAVQFFRHGYTAAGIITASFEAGWYFGGIAGARVEAKLYNERLYERCATPLMNQRGLFPVFMLQYSF
jgi:tetratricopeptide (TPR) repeat protein